MANPNMPPLPFNSTPYNSGSSVNSGGSTNPYPANNGNPNGANNMPRGAMGMALPPGFGQYGTGVPQYQPNQVQPDGYVRKPGQQNGPALTRADEGERSFNPIRGGRLPPKPVMGADPFNPNPYNGGSMAPAPDMSGGGSVAFSPSFGPLGSRGNRQPNQQQQFGPPRPRFDQSGGGYAGYFGGQSPGAGRYRPPTMNGDGRWNDDGGYNYNLPNAFGSYPGYGQGSPYGGGGFGYAGLYPYGPLGG